METFFFLISTNIELHEFLFHLPQKKKKNV